MEDKTTFINWCDHAALPMLNQMTVLDYFCKPSNPFYDKTCNNEHLRMQGFGLVSEQLRSMEGVEFILLHTQPPDLYVVRKQHRLSPTQETPLVDYYVIRGVVYQAPDLQSVLNVRLLNAVHAIRRALDEANTRGRFSVTKGVGAFWAADASGQQADALAAGKRPGGNTVKNRQNDPDRPPTAFQKAHTDHAIAELYRRFPPTPSANPAAPAPQNPQAVPEKAASSDAQQANASAKRVK